MGFSTPHRPHVQRSAHSAPTGPPPPNTTASYSLDDGPSLHSSSPPLPLALALSASEQTSCALYSYLSAFLLVVKPQHSPPEQPTDPTTQTFAHFCFPAVSDCRRHFCESTTTLDPQIQLQRLQTLDTRNPAPSRIAQLHAPTQLRHS